MSSIEELKIVRLFRVYNTVLQMCQDRCYEVRHPTIVADAMKDSALYSPETGLRYDWFCDHFVISPVNITSQLARRNRPSQTRKSVEWTHKQTNIKNNNNKYKKSELQEEEEEQEQQEEQRANDNELDAERNEVEQRVAAGEWIALRNAMRLTCITTNNDEENNHINTNNNNKGKIENNILMVFFSALPALNIKEAQEFRERALRKSASSMIIISAKVNPAVRREVQEMSGRLDVHTGKELLKMQLFEETSLTFNPARHTTVPPHCVLTSHEAEKLLLTRQVKLSQLPRILESDPMVQYLGLSRGDIVKITRSGKESGPYDMFRQVI